MSRYLNFYFSPFENPGSRWNFERLHLWESDCCEVPKCEKPFQGGGISEQDDWPHFMDGIPACIFEASTTPPTLVKDHMGLTFCMKFGHPKFPRCYIVNGNVWRIPEHGGLPDLVLAGPNYVEPQR